MAPQHAPVDDEKQCRDDVDIIIDIREFFRMFDIEIVNRERQEENNQENKGSHRPELFAKSKPAGLTSADRYIAT
jgi:hypothetical protein